MSEELLTPKLEWPLLSPSLEEAIDFIRTSVGDATSVSGPKAVFASYTDAPDIRATVGGATDSARHPEVVLKVSRFPFLSASGAAHSWVSAAAPNHVPEVLGLQTAELGSMILLNSFTGKIVTDHRTISSLLAMARTLAQIQILCAATNPPSEGLQTVAPSDLISIFDQCIANITGHFDAWATDAGAIAEAMGFPGSQVLDRLAPIAPEIAGWIDEVEDVGLGLSIDHGDCHSGNAVQLPSGDILIFDWENASRSHPFFSVEKLMTSAWGLDAGKSGGPWGYQRDTPTQSAIANAYLEPFDLPVAQAHRAFNAAMCLATIKEMHHEMEWARLCGWKDLNPEWTAQLINRLFQHAAYT